MDLTEVEFMNDDLEPREINEKIKELRDALIDNVTSYTSGLPMKNFYDDMRRPYIDVYDYYYAPLKNTPFSIAIAIPQSVGTNILKVNDVIARHHHRGANFVEYFSGDNWKVHPKWTYCKYRYLEGHEFKTSEEEVYHFLKKMSRDDWQWKNQYEEEYASVDMKYTVNSNENEDDDFDEEVCARKTYANDDYFCDRDLMQRMVFDASVTQQAFGQHWKFRNDREEDIFMEYNASLRFVATMSGLTRWQNIYGENSNAKHFGETHSKSIEETWYKSAVNQHVVDSESFVYSVPFDSGASTNGITVTASHAIFPRDAGLEAPGCVVGFQFQHSNFYNRFMEITSKTYCHDCMQPCSDDLVDCYVVDSNGYVVLSENRNDTGRFFGEIESAVMQSMIEIKIYEPVTVYDFQAVCTRLDGDPNDANTLLTPISYVYYFFQWVVYKTMWMAFETNLYSIWADISAVAASFGDIDYGVSDEDEDEQLTVTEPSSASPKPTPRKLRKGQNREEEEYFQKLAEQKPKPVYISEPCDKKATLYTFNQTKFFSGEVPSGVMQSNCSRPYFMKRIPHSNLILMVVNASHQTCSYTLTSSKQDIVYQNDPWPCNKIKLNDLPRRKLAGCYNAHPMERKLYEVCDAASVAKLNVFIFLFVILLIFVQLDF